VPTDADSPLHLTFLQDRPLTQDAVALALERHAGQRRDADGAPFLAHPLEVAALLDRAHYPDHVVASAVLHDVLEDTEAERAELDARFGPEVGELVAAVSDDLSIPGEEARKDDVRERVHRLKGYPAAIYAADKISKVRELRILLATGATLRDVEVRVTRYRKSLEMLDETIPGSRLVATLRFELELLEELPPRLAT
jgi:(p)ppGpp synthase/HD superfamily hydrolase